MRAAALVIALAACGGGGGKQAEPDAGAIVAVGPVTAPDTPRLGGEVIIPIADAWFVVKTEAMVDLAVELPGHGAAVTLRGALLRRVAPGTIAHRLGLADGDVIADLGGTPIRHARDLQDAWLGLRRDGALTAVIERAGARVERHLFLAERLDPDHALDFPDLPVDPIDQALVDALRTGVRPGDPGEIDPAVVEALATEGLHQGSVRTRFSTNGGVAIWPDAPLTTLGLTRWDTLERVDATTLRDASTVAPAFAGKSAGAELTLTATRISQPLTLRFRITPGLADRAALAAALEAWKAREAQAALEAEERRKMADAIKDAPELDWSNGLTRIDDTHFEVDRALITLLLDNPLGLAKGARVMPSMKNGQPNGFKIYAVRPGSPFAAFGLANGDTLQTLNGQKLTSPSDFALVERLVKKAKTIELGVVRRGKPLTIEYRIK